MRLKKSYALLLAVSIVLTMAVPLVLGGLDQFRLLSRLSWWAIVALVLIILVSWVFNAVRLRLLMGTMGWKIGMGESGLITIAAEFAGNSTPGAVGMPVTYTFLLRKRKITFGSAVGMISVIVLFDVLFFGTLMPLAAIALLFEKSPETTSRMVAVVTVVVMGGSLLLWAGSRYYRPVCRFVGHHMARWDWLAKRRYRLARMTVEFLRALRVFRTMSWTQRLGLYLVTMGYWMPRYAVLAVVISIVGKKVVPFSYVFLMQGLLNLGGQVFILPGGGGGVDVAYSVLMSPYLAPEMIAFTLIAWRVYTFYLHLIVGGPIFLLKTGEAARELLGKRTTGS